MSRITIISIQQRVAEHYRLRAADMRSPVRERCVAHPRQLAMYLSRRLTPLSLPEIGRRFGGRDHSTVIHALVEVRKRIATDPKVRRALSRIAGRLVA